MSREGVCLALAFVRRNAASPADGLLARCRGLSLGAAHSLKRKTQMRKSVMFLIAGACLSSTVIVHAENAPVHATADDSPAAETETHAPGTVDLTGGSVAAGIGFSWGHGQLNYGGQSYSFK